EEGLLNVASEGGFCEVSIDGRSHGLTPVGGIHLPEGPAVVSCRGRHRTLERQIEVTPGQRLRVSFDLVSGSSREVPPAVDWGF
ncbi:MAG: PEGA domain-containing protein, partial [Myxococcales bacterium]|nr:PEGA domain-containing protein [Myxococcales bacterium]